MNDDELRDMIRESIARHLGGEPRPPEAPWRQGERAGHASHLQFPLQRGGDGDGACLIEPSVRCTHCGYCLSYGH
jgi:hypothetical protein